MRIRKVVIENIRSIERLEWQPPRAESPGWNVILGDNGSGKSSFLRAISLALIGPREAVAARQDWNTWLRSGSDAAQVRIEIVPDEEFDFYSGQGRTADVKIAAAVKLSRADGTTAVEDGIGKAAKMHPSRHIWGTGGGWFSAAYGPFRRFSGGDKDAERSFLSNPKLGAHLSVFGENVALNESLFWLRELNYKSLEGHSDGELLGHLKQFVNQDGFLPHNMKLTAISSEGVQFEDANGSAVLVEELSDGYRSILSMTFELIRQLSRYYSPSALFDEGHEKVVVPGVVLIDEVDAHLHPTWQKRIGLWLTAHFPRVQFIVTTHSPLICQAAANGSIFLLPRPGSEDVGRMLEGADYDRLVYGDISDAYSTGAFGSGATRSAKASEMRERLAVLNVKEVRSGLSAGEQAEQIRLRAAFPTGNSVRVSE
jgi:hypothetical protein